MKKFISSSKSKQQRPKSTSSHSYSLKSKNNISSEGLFQYNSKMKQLNNLQKESVKIIDLKQFNSKKKRVNSKIQQHFQQKIQAQIKNSIQKFYHKQSFKGLNQVISAKKQKIYRPIQIKSKRLYDKKNANSQLKINASTLVSMYKNRQNRSHSDLKSKPVSKNTSNYNTIQQKFQLQFRYSFRTKKGVLSTNPNKTNQDNYIIAQNFTKKNDKQLSLFAVADGHGIHGHHVSKIIADQTIEILKKQLSKSNVQKSIAYTYNQLQHIISCRKEEINVLCSGSTLVCVLIEGNTLICSNVGDSRAVLARQVDRKCWQMIYLSEDHKPSLQKQKKRILSKGGRIAAFKDENNEPIGPLRVWLPHQNVQGLAMSRSLGDNISKPIGVTHQPELIKLQLESRDKFIVIGSDGVWQFLTNQEVLQLIAPYYRENKLQQACDALLKLAYEKWTTEDCTVVDDITFILIFLGK